MLCHTFRSLPSARVSNAVNFSRSFYPATGSLISLSSDGKPVTKKVDLWHGDPNDWFIVIAPDVGFALQAGIALSNNAAFNRDPEKQALTFFHETKTFAHESSPSIPRLEIHRDLPKQTETNKSPATLFLFGVGHTIALDGTADAKFAKDSAESYKRLKPALDLLKGM